MLNLFGKLSATQPLLCQLALQFLRLLLACPLFRLQPLKPCAQSRVFEEEPRTGSDYH